MSRRLMLPGLAMVLSGCLGQVNARSEVSYLADDLICTIDQSVVDENDKLLPQGWLTKTYAPSYWQEYWNARAYNLGRETFDDERALGYAGPSGRVLVLYALQQRREQGLPDLLPEDRNDSLVSELYEELQRDPRSSCDILDRPSPVCTLGPAQRPAAMEFRRGCGVPAEQAFEPRPIRR